MSVSVASMVLLAANLPPPAVNRAPILAVPLQLELQPVDCLGRRAWPGYASIGFRNSTELRALHAGLLPS
jgi:hypothetical protein